MAAIDPPAKPPPPVWTNIVPSPLYAGGPAAAAWGVPFNAQPPAPSYRSAGGAGDRNWLGGGGRAADTYSRWSEGGGLAEALSQRFHHLSAALGGGQPAGWSSTRRECLPHVLEGQDRYICDESERMVCLGEQTCMLYVLIQSQSHGTVPLQRWGHENDYPF